MPLFDDIRSNKLIAETSWGEYRLLAEDRCLIKLVYCPNLEVENQGGTMFRCDLEGQSWYLRHFRHIVGGKYEVHLGSTLYASCDDGYLNSGTIRITANGHTYQKKAQEVKSLDGTAALKISRLFTWLMPQYVFQVIDLPDEDLIPLLLIELHAMTAMKG